MQKLRARGESLFPEIQLNAEPVAECSLAMIILAARRGLPITASVHREPSQGGDVLGNFTEVGLYGAQIDSLGVANFALGH